MALPAKLSVEVVKNIFVFDGTRMFITVSMKVQRSVVLTEAFSFLMSGNYHKLDHDRFHPHNLSSSHLTLHSPHPLTAQLKEDRNQNFVLNN